MKKLIIVLSLLSFVSVSFGQSKSSKRTYYPGPTISRAFSQEFGAGTPVTWSFVNTDLVMGVFNIDRASVIVYYDADGNLAYKFQEVAMDDLPRKALEKVGNIFADYAIQEIRETWTEDDHCIFILGANGNNRRIVRVCPKGTVGVYKDYRQDDSRFTIAREVAGL